MGLISPGIFTCPADDRLQDRLARRKTNPSRASGRPLISTPAYFMFTQHFNTLAVSYTCLFFWSDVVVTTGQHQLIYLECDILQWIIWFICQLAARIYIDQSLRWQRMSGFTAMIDMSWEDMGAPVTSMFWLARFKFSCRNERTWELRTAHVNAHVPMM